MSELFSMGGKEEFDMREDSSEATARTHVPPAGTVTFLFTNIEGSTGLLQRIGSSYADILVAHHRVLRATCAAHQGYEVETPGDSVILAFPSAPQAVAAAAEAALALAAHPWPQGVTIRARMGLHTGMPEMVGGQYVGLDVHRAARIAAAGHGGQILLSAATVALVRDALPNGASLRNLGTHRLKDLLRPEPLFQLILPGLPDTFPPLRALEDAHNNLPAQPTPLLGRERELAQVCERLRAPTTRLVTLLGPGGIGKTRLAAQVAADLKSELPDGAYFVMLAPLTDAAAVLPAVTHALGIREGTGEPLARTLRDFVREKRLLLVLDNLEHLLDPVAALVADLLVVAPHLKVLATSRAPLRVSGEHEFEVPPLGSPDPRHLPPLEDLATYPSVQLLTQRAVAAKSDFKLTAANASAVAQICVLLDGLPLALELAAARIKVLALPALLRRLAPEQSGGTPATRLRLLTGGARDLPARQRTLADTIAWSYDLLSEEERMLFRHLAVFVGGWTLEAAEAMVQAGDALALDALGLDVLDVLQALVDNSLIRREESADDDAGGDVRFGMLQTIREFALLRLEEAGEAAAARAAHAHYFAGLAETARGQLAGPEQATWHRRLDAEHGNLLAMLAWARDEPHVALGMQAACMLGLFWEVRGYYTEGRAWLETFLALGAGETEAGATSAIAPALRAGALRFLGRMLLAQGDLATAQAVLEQALATFRALGDLNGVAGVLIPLGATAYSRGDYAASEAFSTEGLVLARQHRPGALPALLENLGTLMLRLHDFERAAAYLEESERLAQQRGDARSVAYTRMSLGRVAFARGDTAEAVRRLRSCLRLACELGLRVVVASSLESLAAALVVQGEHEAAARLLGMAAAQWEEVAVTRGAEEQPMYDGTVAQLRAHLGDVMYDAAYAAGRAATPEEEIPPLFMGDE